MTRPARVKVRYQDEHGSKKEIEGEGLMAACLQHEIDHLNGVLFVDYLSALKRNMLLRKLAKDQKEKAGAQVKLAFMGSPDFSVPALKSLVAAGHEVAVVYAQPPKPAHRGQKETPCPVHQAALELGLPVRTPRRLRKNEEEAAFFRSLNLDAAVVAAYGLILPPEILQAPKQGCVNIHASLLPRWRGAAPIQAAILAGDAETGITIMQMDEGLDTGAMLLGEATPIGPQDTAADLHDRLAEIGGRLILRALDERPAPRAAGRGAFHLRAETLPRGCAAQFHQARESSWNARSAPTRPGRARWPS